MIQQRHENNGRKSIKKLLAQLAIRQSDWRKVKTKQIKISQKYGFNASATLRVDFSQNNKKIPVVKSVNNSAKHIEEKPDSKFKKQPLNLSGLELNGESPFVKRNKIVKNNIKKAYFNTISTIQDENQPPKHEKQIILPKINVDLRIKTSFDCLKSDSIEKQRGFDSEKLQIIEQQQPSVVKKEIDTFHKFAHKVSY